MNERQTNTVRFGIFQKIMLSVGLLLLLYMSGAMAVAIISNQNLGRTIDSKFEQAFKEIFTNIGTVFDDFEVKAKENIRKTSGLLSLERVWGEFLNGHERFLKSTQEEMTAAHLEISSALKSYGAEEELKKRIDQIWDRTYQKIALNGKKIDEEVRMASGMQVKNAISQMGKANVVLVGSQEVTRRRIEDIKSQVSDSIKKSIEDSNRLGIITLFSSMLFITFLVSIVSLFFAHSLSRPIRKMVDVLHKMGKGDLPASQIEVKSSDEIGMLAQAFNDMSSNLKNVTASRDELNKEIAVRKQTEEALHEAYKELQSVQAQVVQSEKMASIGQLAAGVAHEINNPMGFINNNLEMLEQYITEYIEVIRMNGLLQKSVEEGDLSKAAELIKKIKELEGRVQLDQTISDVAPLLEHTRKGVDRVQKIVMDLRTFAREDRDSIELIKIEEVIDSVLSIVHNEIKYKAILEKNYSETPRIKGNPQKLGQVFINLLINAVQAIHDRGTIKIKTYVHNGFVCIDIADTGSGIAPENLVKIFDPFFTTKPVGQGTGLGLSISYEVIKKHKGEIKVQSKVNEGSCFTVMLPTF